MRQESRVNRAVFWVTAVFFMLGSIGMKQAVAQSVPEKGCTVATLNGVYVFDATGYDIVNSAPAPKAIVEFLTFHGDGTLNSLATVSLDGTIHSGIAGSGNYTINSNCTGTLTFNGSGLTFDLYIASTGNRFHMIETVSNTVLSGEVQRIPQ